MTRTFVAIDDPLHRLLRNVTHRTALAAVVNGAGKWLVNYQVNPPQIPDTYFSLALLHGLGGMDAKRAMSTQASFGVKHRAQILEQVQYFDITKLDRRCSRDIRLKLPCPGAVMVSGETLCFGTGTLRALNDDPRDQVHAKLREQHGRIATPHQKTFALIRALPGRKLSADGKAARDSYESTNVLYGDVIGEIQQLWERRADLGFLDGVAQSLCEFKLSAVPSVGPQPPLNVEGIVALHLRRQALWRTPPRTGRALMKRIEFILTNTILDSWPKTRFLRRSAKRSSGDKKPSSPFDTSGYDGWLSN